MEHEVVVPLPANAVRQVLQDSELLARCVPGLSTDAGTARTPDGQVDGRLKLRVGGSTITYRGSLSLIPGRAGVLTALAEGEEVRGSAEVTATVRVSVHEHADGSVLRFAGDLSAEGRLAEFPDDVLRTAGRRLLDRVAAALAVEAGAGPETVLSLPDDETTDTEQTAAAEPEPAAAAEPEPVAEADEPAVEAPLEAAAETSEEQEAEQPEESREAAAEAEESETEESQADESDGTEEPDEAAAEEEPGATVVYLDDHAVRDLDDDLSDLIAFSDEDEPLPSPDSEPAPFEYQPEPAMSGPVRRSIVGRSAEEVDHAPPHGRYAPTPPARSARARAASRWGGAEPTLLTGGAGERSAMPWVIGGGVALIGGAVVLVRALRRR
ncbi:SRPBCC domain-containing protein [Kitasatospora sp. NPDC085879]|uniref:SRPBCC domain-containing protein n=1 Tax=Kitasatospora sp. NPDC085879 TaxID=3154769 RepID=UPI00344753D9